MIFTLLKIIRLSFFMMKIQEVTDNLIISAVVKEIRKANLELYIWTVNDPDKTLRLLKAGVKGVTADRPSWLGNRLNRTFYEFIKIGVI